jgi:hypothetical protein
MLYPAELRARAVNASYYCIFGAAEVMSRNPFAWEVQVLREVLDDEMARLRQVPYAAWRGITKVPISRLVLARDNRPYRLKASAEFVHADSEDIRVTLSLSRSGLLRRGLLRQTFIITPANTFRV